jgi:voltage-gated potassium channel
VHIPSNLKAGFVALAVVIVIGSAGFVLIGGLSMGNALYLTFITITTLGYSEIGGPFDVATRVWVVIVLIAGMGAAIYTLTAFVEYGFETLVGSDHRRRRKMARAIGRISNHVIVCGYGRVGATAAAALHRDGIPLVVIEHKADAVEAAMNRGFIVIEGNATRDETLLEARIQDARSVIACVASSSDNLVITLSVRALRPDIPVTARAVDEQTEHKLLLAGANAVVTPEQVGGERIAALATQPGLAEFIDTIVQDSATEFRIRRFVISSSSITIGRTLADLELRRDSGAMVIGVAQEGEPLRINPDPHTPFESGDCVFGVGSAVQLQSLELLLEQ